MNKQQQQTLVMVAALGAAVFLMMRHSKAAAVIPTDGQASNYTPPPAFGVGYNLPDWLTKPWGEFTPPGPVTQPYVSQPFGVGFAVI